MFSKSQRFTDKNVGATPGPAEYNPKLGKSAAIAAFPKEQRFSDSSDTESLGPGTYSHTIIGKVKKSEFKIPSSKQRTKKKSQRQAMFVQTDISGAISTEQPGSNESKKVVTELRDQCTLLQSRLDDLQANSDREQEKLCTQISSLDDQVAQLNSLLDTERGHVSQLTSQLDEATVLADNANKERMAAGGEVGRLNAEVEEVVASRLLCVEELQVSADKLEKGAERVEELEYELKKLRVEHERRFRGLTDEMSLEIGSLKNTVGIQEDTIASLTSSLSRETELRIATEASSDNKTETIACLKSTVEQQQTDISQWEKLHNSRVERQGELEQQVTCTSTSIISLADQLEKLKIANEQSRVVNELLQSTNEISTTKIAALQRSVQSKDDEIQELQDKLGHARMYQEVVREKEAKIEQLLDLNNLLSAKLDDHKQLQDKINSMDELISSMETKRSDEILSYSSMLAEAQTERERVDERSRELEQKIAQQTSSTVELKDQYSNKIVSLQTKVCDVEEQVKRKDEEMSQLSTKFEEEKVVERKEMLRVQALYEDLQKKVAPFKEQLDAYELEMNSLEGQSKNWASEAAKAAQEYAKLLGHQNQRQKIKRINQISEENFTLKQEVMNLRSNEAKLKRQLGHVQDKLRSTEGKRRFDPSKAFQREDVENEGRRSPLKCFNSNSQ